MSIISVGINSLGYYGKVYICHNTQNKKDEVEKLIKELKDKDEPFFSRASAAKALGSIGNARAAESLLDALNDGNKNVRMAAGEALYPMLNSFSGERRLNILLGLIKCDVADIQLKAIVELQKIGLKSNDTTKNQILEVFNDRLGIGLLNPQEEKDPLVLEAMRKAYNRIKESMKGGK